MLKSLWHPQVFLSVTLQAWHTFLGEVSVILFSSLQHLCSSIMLVGSIGAQIFSDLSRDVWVPVWTLVGQLKDLMLSIQAKECNLCFIRPENFVSHLIKRKGSHLIALQVPFGKLQLNYHVAFTKQSLPSGHCIIQAWVECSKNTCPSGKFSSLHRATLDFCQWPLGCWWTPWLLLRLARQPTLGRVLVVPNVFHSWLMEATELTVTFNAADMFLFSPNLFIDTSFWGKGHEYLYKSYIFIF